MGSGHCGIPKPDPPLRAAKIRRPQGLEHVQLRGRVLTFWGLGNTYRKLYTTEQEAERVFEELKKGNKR